MLSEHEQRALEELERCYAIGARDPLRSHRPAGPARRPSGSRTVLLLVAVSGAGLFAGVPTAGFALALATALGWVLWRLWAHRTDDGSLPVPPRTAADRVPERGDHRPGESIRRYLTWLAEPV